MVYTLDQIKDFADNPINIPTSGTYGEGVVYNIAEMMRSLKESIKKGELSVNDYFNVADPLLAHAQTAVNSIAGAGSKNASAVNPAWQQIQQLGAVKAKDGQWQTTLPITSREYANLPESVLPTQKDVQSGRIPIDLLPPVQRYRPEPATPTPTDGQPQVNPGPGGAVQPPTTKVPDPANPGQFINIPIVGDPLANSVPRTVDQSVIEAEGARQAEQSRQAFEAEKSIRSKRLTDLAGLLTQQENQKFSQDQPGIYEDLNSRGLLRSSGLGEALAREKAKLAGDSANVLATQGLTDRDAEIGGIKDILARTQSFQTSGLERKFTLEDFQKEAEMARALGSQYQPTVKGGNSVLSGVLGGGLSGAASGAAIGSVVPGIGTGIGAGVGALLGSAGGAAKGNGK